VAKQLKGEISVEKDSIEIIDYLRIIWKRKLFIIIVIMVGVGVGLGMVSKASELYNVDVLLHMGKKMKFTPSGSYTLAKYDSPANILKILQVKFDMRGAHLNNNVIRSQAISGTGLIRVTMEGADKRSVEIFKEIMEEFCNDHCQRTEDSFQPFYAAVERKKAYYKTLLNEVVKSEKWLKEFESAKHTVDVLALIRVESNLQDQQARIRELQDQLMFYKAFNEDVDSYRTKIVGSFNSGVISSSKRGHVIKVVSLSLVISILSAFFIEYIERENKIKREKDGA